MRRVTFRLIAGVLALLLGGPAFAQVGLGLTVSDDVPDVPDVDELYSRLIAADDIAPGILVYFVEEDWGMSFDFGFDLTSSQQEPTPSDPMYLDFSFAVTYDWHPVARFIIDPFLQLGGGFDMAAPVTDTADLVKLRFHPVLGAGLNVKFGNAYARANIQYQGVSLTIPAPDIAPYEAGPYRVVLSAGFLFR